MFKLFGIAALALALSACGQQDKAADAAAEQEALAARDRLDTAPPAFRACLACHTVERGRNGSGPSLVGMMGRKAGSLPGFPYSPALATSGIVWTPETLDRWLAGPIRMVPGTRMVMPVPDPAQRKAVIDYLATLR